MAPVIVLGDVLLDYMYQVEEMPPVGGDAAIFSQEQHPGGAGLNTSIGLAASGVRSALVGAVGDDEQGRRLEQRLSEGGVDTSHLRRGSATGYVLSFADAHGERTMFSCRASSAAPVELTAELGAALERTPLLFLSGYGLQDRDQAESYLACARRVKGAGGLVAFDPTPVIGRVAAAVVEAAVALTDVLLPNEAELKAVSGRDRLKEAIRWALGRVSHLGLKLGRSGSLTAVVRGGAPIVLERPAPEVSVMDTAGAGDAFNAGFLAALVRGLPPEKWGEWGNDLAARVVAKRGASLHPHTVPAFLRGPSDHCGPGSGWWRR
jgi:sugar/nucleoside kinase (ribokinase family)